MASRTELRCLQAAIALAGLVPVGAGAAGVALGGAMMGGAMMGGAMMGGAMMGDAAASSGLDSHMRYLSGLLLGIGVLFWAMIPTIARRGTVVRALTFLVVVGGLARLAGFATRGLPDTANSLAVLMELVVTPLLCLWQARIAR